MNTQLVPPQRASGCSLTTVAMMTVGFTRNECKSWARAVAWVTCAYRQTLGCPQLSSFSPPISNLYAVSPKNAVLDADLDALLLDAEHHWIGHGWELDLELHCHVAPQ